MADMGITSIRKTTEKWSVRFVLIGILVLLLTFRIISVVDSNEQTIDITKNNHPVPIKITGDKDY
jgi:hypothetical protein